MPFIYPILEVRHALLIPYTLMFLQVYEPSRITRGLQYVVTLTHNERDFTSRIMMEYNPDLVSSCIHSDPELRSENLLCQ